MLLDAEPSHLHFARLQLPDGSVVERVLSETAPHWPLDLAGGERETALSGSSLLDYWGIGIEHILSGWDHLAFVIALLLLARTFGEVATLVTGFTVAHSVTLGLAVLRVLQPDTAAVEALIGFSIALVGAENAWLLTDRGRLVPTMILLGLLALAALAAAGLGILSSGILLGLALFSGCHFGLLSVATRPARLRTAFAFAFASSTALASGFPYRDRLADRPHRAGPAGLQPRRRDRAARRRGAGLAAPALARESPRQRGTSGHRAGLGRGVRPRPLLVSQPYTLVRGQRDVCDGVVAPLLQELVWRDRVAEQVALHARAAKRRHELHLFLGLHTLGDRRKAELGSDGDYGPRDGRTRRTLCMSRTKDWSMLSVWAGSVPSTLSDE